MKEEYPCPIELSDGQYTFKNQDGTLWSDVYGEKGIFRAAEVFSEGFAAVELKNIMLTDGEVEEPHDDISYKINIRGQSTSPDLPENPDVDSENNNLNTTVQESEDKNTSSLSVSGTTTQQNTTNDETASNTKLPATGLNVTIILVLVLAIILGIAALVKYRKNK